MLTKAMCEKNIVLNAFLKGILSTEEGEHYQSFQDDVSNQYLTSDICDHKDIMIDAIMICSHTKSVLGVAKLNQLENEDLLNVLIKTIKEQE